MKTLVRSSQRGRLLTAVATAAAALSLVSVAPATAAPFTYDNGAGASVEFSATKVSANLPATQRILVKGTGFVGTSPDAEGTQPVVAFKFDAADTLVGWGSDTGDRWTVDGSPKLATFKASLTTGSFEGWIDLPTNISPDGSGLAPAPTRHVVNVLSGTYSTKGAGVGNRTSPFGIRGFVDALTQPTTGFQQGPMTAFFAGTVIPTVASTSLKVSGNLDTAAATPVTVTFDGTPITTAKNFGTQNALTTDAGGAFEASVPVPGGAAGGEKILSLSAGGTTQSVVIVVKPRIAVRESTQTPSPGDTVTVTGTGFQGIGATGQKVGLILMPGDKLIGCAEADGRGNVSISGVVPADTTLGDKNLWLAVGAKCVPMGAVIDPVPGLVQLTGEAGIKVVEKPAPTPTPTPIATPAPMPIATPTPLSPPNTVLPDAPKAAKVKSTAKGSNIEITFGADAAGASVKIGAKTKSKVKLTSKAKAKIVTVASAKTVKAPKGKAPKVVIKLTADGKRLLKARGSLKIVITIQQTGRAPVTKTVTIKP